MIKSTTSRTVIQEYGKIAMTILKIVKYVKLRVETKEESEIIKKLAQFPWVVTSSAQYFEPHRITVYLLELVAQFHSYYNKHRVITHDEEQTKARLFLINAIKTTVKNGNTRDHGKNIKLVEELIKLFS